MTGSLVVLLIASTALVGETPRPHQWSENGFAADALRYGDTFEWNAKGPEELLDLLKNRLSAVGPIYTVHGTHAGWLREADLPTLVALVDSKEPCAHIVMSASSYLPTTPSFVGQEALFLIEGFRTGEYPPRLHSEGFYRTRAEIMVWWRARNAAHETDTRTAGTRLLAIDPDCGDPARVSQTYSLCFAKVLSVLDGQTLLVDLYGDCPVRKTTATGRVQVRLVQLTAPDLASELGRRAKAALAARVLDKAIKILASPYQDGHGLIAMVLAPSDVGLDQLEAGLASYRNYGPYALDSFQDCVYTRAEAKARAEGSGIWHRE